MDLLQMAFSSPQESPSARLASPILGSSQVIELDTIGESKVDVSKDEEQEVSWETGAFEEGRTKRGELQIEVKNVHKTYLLGIEGVPALRGVSLSIMRGEFLCILGKSGGGKTSLLNILGTIDKPTKGELFICKQRITANTTDAEFSRLRLEKIGFVFQSFNLISTMTALENVKLPMILRGELSKGQMDARARGLLESVGIGQRSTHLPSQLSGGEQQRVTIARAMANEPEILLLDEPTGDLDTKNSNLILSLLLQLNRQKGITLIMVTHDRSLKHYAHRVVHMVDGKAVNIEQVRQEARDRAEAELREKLNQNVARRSEQDPVIVEYRDTTTFYANVI